MKTTTLSDLETFIVTFSQVAVKNIVKANDETAEILTFNIRNDAPIDTGQYADSIGFDATQVEKTTFGVRVSTSVNTTQTLGERGSKSPRWANVPLGALLEWGTGSLGASTGDAEEYGYSYNGDIVGMPARPHFLPNLYKIKPVYRKKLKEALRKSWKRQG